MIDAIDFQLIAAVQAGLPIAARPYAAIAAQLALSEQDVIDRLMSLKSQGLIKRWGVVVKHRQLGYRTFPMNGWRSLAGKLAGSVSSTCVTNGRDGAKPGRITCIA